MTIPLLQCTAQWFSMLDLASGYWQVEVEPADREKTAFATAHGLYQFRVMLFGLCIPTTNGTRPGGVTLDVMSGLFR